MLTKQSLGQQVLAMAKPALFVLTGGIATSELAHRQERQDSPVKENVHILAHEIFECEDTTKQNPPTLVFLEGWPDDCTLFRPFATALARNYRCVNCNLPGYPLPKKFDGHSGSLPAREWGFTLDEASLLLQNTIRATCQSASSITLVTHDWGAIIGYLLHNENPGDVFINRMVSLDVGWRVDGFPILGATGVIAYQAALNFFFMLPNSIGGPLTGLEQLLLGRVASPGASPVTNAMNWPYRSAWRDMLTNGALTKMRTYIPTKIPMLFIHGNSLPTFIRFFDDKWVEYVKNTYPGISKVASVPGNHWFMNSNFDETLKLITEWLERSEGHVKPSRL